MAGHHRSRPAEDDSSDDLLSADEEREEIPSSIRRSNGKRARVERAASSPALSTPESPLLPDSYRSTSRQQNGANGDGISSSAALKHQPGSIVRVKLTNFVTYTSAEFHPGPSLNMVIGPNGTGKSTLVCAICLGLGANTAVLGRAKDISDFVKRGTREAEIEIELAADPNVHDSNPVIRHNIKRKDNKSSWFINGRSTNRKAVVTLCRQFSIQIDNLCQFLPQDRVVEFAALSSTELLRETQRAAAPEYMTQWHETLKKIRAEQRTSFEARHNNAEQLKNLEGRQNLQRGDVERLRERAEIQERLTAMKRLRPFPRYNAARFVYTEAKDARKGAETTLRLLEREVEPALRAVNNKQIYVDGVQKVVEQRNRIANNMEEKARALLVKQQELLERITDCETRVEAEKSGSKKAKQERVRLEGLIRDTKRQIETTNPGEIDFTVINEQIRDFQRRIREKEDLADTARSNYDQNNHHIGSLNQRLEMTTRNMEGLRSKAGQLNNKLRTLSRDTATAWDWIQENKNRFSGLVFGPPLVACSLKDQKYANFLEASVGQADLLAFTVTNNADYNLLSNELTGRMGLADVNLRSCQRPLSSWNPPIPREQSQDFGLAGYVLDLIEGPEEVLSMLCDNRNIHSMGYFTRDVDNDQYEALSRSPITSWITPSESYFITRRREFGDQGISTRSARLREARFFTNEAIDTREEERLKNEKLELQHELEEFRTKSEGYKSELVRYTIAIKELKAQQSMLAEEKSAKQRAISDYAKLAPRLQTHQAKLEQSIAEATSYRERVQRIKDEQETLVLTRGEESLKLMAIVMSLQKLQTDLFDAEVLLIEAKSEFEVMQARNEQVRARLQVAHEDVRRLKRGEDELKRIAQAVLNEVNALMQGEMTDLEQELQQTIVSERKSPDEWEAEIEATSARLEMVHAGNPHIIQEFENRAMEIDRIRGKLTRLDQELSEVEGKITEIRQRWEPELDALVGQISEAFGDNFARMGLAGEVQVAKDDDFENWAIEIRVKFREDEQMSILDSHRQSGGERAVSTIFYLMALQSLARAPFRVVDEINQGMDPRNERMVHSRIVDIACAQNTSQYFLITPKLLPNLKYHASMKVHCIASGEYMPEDHRQLDFQVLAERALRVRSSGGGGGVV